eukprot:CAMPEP_0115754284 /NCGR_PEP_ID=MMETSP0272-20121206/96788_1 /TAXON_ID=71861 /ORGANISM="Scrippsiella trochoidea, Strain CCMP3099" /LENGTH=55 /DNA_ID=CAMNT_0003199681 /DNA_START=300 /DNA_END=467 /DNA_ORIENTATION=-
MTAADAAAWDRPGIPQLREAERSHELSLVLSNKSLTFHPSTKSSNSPTAAAAPST